MTEVTSVEIAGPIRRIALPDICACCGAPASERILIERDFQHWSHDSESYSWWEYAGVRVPFCSVCAAKHYQLEQRITPARRLLLLLQTWMAIPMLASAAFAAYFFLLGLAHPEGAIFTMVAAAVFALIALGSTVAGWRSTRHRAIAEPTSVTACFVFTENQAKMLEPERRTFAEANRRRIWNPAGPRARMARRWRQVVWALLGLAALGAIIWDYLRRH